MGRKRSIKHAALAVIMAAILAAHDPTGPPPVAYAAEDDNSAASVKVNGGAYGKRIGAAVNTTIDVKEGLMRFRPVYHDQSRTTSITTLIFSNVTLSDSDGNETQLTPNQCSVLTKIYEFLMNEIGFSDEMAAGACGNIYQECYLDPESEASGGCGIAQWMGKRKDRLKAYANEVQGTVSSLDTQLGYIKKELMGDKSYGITQINKYLQEYAGSKDGKTVDVTNINDVSMATDAWCAVFEGGSSTTKTESSAANTEAGNTANGTYCEDLGTRKRNALTFYQVKADVTSSSVNPYEGVGGLYSDGLRGNEKILIYIFGEPNKELIFQRYTTNQIVRGWCTSSVTVRNSNGITFVMNNVNKYVSEELQQAINEITATGFVFLEEETGVYADRVSRSDEALMSFHALGMAIDVNWNHNPYYDVSEYPTTDLLIKQYNPNQDEYAVSKAEYVIFKRHGWLWGRDFSSGTHRDLMHFSVGEVDRDGANKQISEEIESRNRH